MKRFAFDVLSLVGFIKIKSSIQLLKKQKLTKALFFQKADSCTKKENSFLTQWG